MIAHKGARVDVDPEVPRVRRIRQQPGKMHTGQARRPPGLSGIIRAVNPSGERESRSETTGTDPDPADPHGERGGSGAPAAITG